MILTVRNLQKSFRMGDAIIPVLRGVDLDVQAGEFIAIEGRSGSGKSTLMHLMGALDAPDAGAIQYNNRDLANLSSAARSEIRNTEFGFVFQFYHLLPELNVLENTLLAAMVTHSPFAWLAKKPALKDQARQILTTLGMDHRTRHKPNQLSGGERQRVAIARALMNKPKVLFADEPTGNLDAETGRQIMSVLEKLHRENNQTILMVTHDRTLAKTADRVLILKEGKIIPNQ